MDLEDVRKGWEKWGKTDPMYAILTIPDKLGNKWNREEFFRSGEEEIRGLLEYFESTGIPIHYGTALDFGCGIGRLSQALAAHFDKVYGVDISSTMVDNARAFNRFGPRVEYHVNEKNDLSLFPDNTFDLVYTIITLQHLEPRYIAGYIREFIRTVKIEGILVFQVPSRIKTGHLLLPSPEKSSTANREEPFREMFGIKKEEVVALLQEKHMQIFAIKDDHSAGPEWESYLYFSRKLQ
jgi:SAM-dependent methyltransferase